MSIESWRSIELKMLKQIVKIFAIYIMSKLYGILVMNVIWLFQIMLKKITLSLLTKNKNYVLIGVDDKNI